MSQCVFNDGQKQTNVYLKNVKTEATKRATACEFIFVYALFVLYLIVFFFPTSGSDI